MSSTIAANGSGAAVLYPGSTTTYAVTINNPNPYPVKVVNISASASKVAGSCPAGTVTSPAVANPTGTIAPNGSGSYTLTATMVTDPDNSCQGQSFEMPLNASLASAAG